jgi:DNA modification methylase
VIADNKLAQNAGWDNEVLAIELDALSSAGLEIEVLGFSTAEIDLVFDTAAEAKTALRSPEDSVPAVDATALVSRSGDLWTMGDHILACGDARDKSVYGNTLMGQKAALVITDPPYNVKIDRNVAGHGSIRYREFGMASGEMNEAQFTDFLRTICERLVENSIDGSIHYIFMDWRHMRELLAAGGPVFSELKNICVWNKTNGGLGSFYRSKHELVFVWKAGTASHINNFGLGQHGRVRTNVWDYAGINTFRKGRMGELALHPTVKPVALVADAIKDCSRRGDIVLDPFCGSGTILIAAEKTGRKARAVDIDPIYVDTAVKRWEAYTGKFATLFGTNDTFELIAERRKQLAPVPV